MTVYRTCARCAHASDCSIKRALSEAISGHGVTAIKHKCRSFEPLFKPGQHVWAKVKTNGSWFDSSAIFPAVFMQFRTALYGAVVWIENGSKSQCGRYEFTPLDRGACSVTFNPRELREHEEDRYAHIRHRIITGLRNGCSPICQCGAQPAKPRCCELEPMIKNERTD